MTSAQTYTGNIVRLLSHGSFGGAIFSLEVYRSPRKMGGSVVVVVADVPLFVERPLVGEPWKVEGYWIDNPSYGRQFKATAATHWKPSGRAVVDFLGKSGIFGTLTVRDANRLWKELGSSLVTALDEGDILTLARAGVRLEKCRSLVYNWLHYWSMAKVKDLLLRGWVHPRLAERIHGVFGTSAYQLILENPYRLAPFLNWKELDRLPTKIGINLPQEVRGLGACIHLLLDMQRRGRVSTRYSYVVNRLSLRLGSTSAAATALKQAVENKTAFVVTQGGTQYVHAAGAEFVQRALCTSLLLRREATAAPEQKKPSVEVISAPLLDVESVVISLAQTEQGVTHILGSIDTETSGVIEAMAHRAISPTSVLCDAHPNLPWADADVVVHDADQLSFVTLNKLLRRLQSASRIRILGRAHGYPVQTDGPSVFADIALSGTLPLTTLMSDRRAEVIAGKPNFKLAKSSAPTSICRLRPTSIYWHSTSTAKEASSTAAAFRECAHYGSTVLFTAHAGEAMRWNMLFHNEVAEYRVSSGERSHVVRLQNQQSGTDGDPIVLLRSDLERGLIAGTRGILSASDNIAYFLPLQGDVTHDMLTIEGVGKVPVSPEHLSNSALSYAVPLRTPFLGSVDYVVVLLTSDYSTIQTELLVSRGVCHARRGVLIVSEQYPEFGFNCNLRESPSDASIAGFRRKLILAQRELFTRESLDGYE